jgi:hypothetical protein
MNWLRLPTGLPDKSEEGERSLIRIHLPLSTAYADGILLLHYIRARVARCLRACSNASTRVRKRPSH